VNSQHLSDEAVAAFADGVLGGHARDRARRHVEECAECRTAVRVQREAAVALRGAAAPALPTELMARLCSLPQTTPVSTLPTTVAPDGSTVLAARYMAPMSGLVPTQAPAPKQESTRRVKPIVTAVAVAALAGALSAGSVASRAQSPAQVGTGQTAHHGTGGPGTSGGVVPVNVFRAHQP
jgi:Putative zinc-finger